MIKSRRWCVTVWVMAASLFGCASASITPPSETTMTILRAERNKLDARIASGHLTPAQARELWYQKLADIQPPLPDLNQLVEFRRQVEAQIDAKTLTPEQGEARLTARESDMLTRWEEMAAKYAAEQRRFEQLRKQQEQGFQEQQLPMYKFPRP